MLKASDNPPSHFLWFWAPNYILSEAKMASSKRNSKSPNYALIMLIKKNQGFSVASANYRASASDFFSLGMVRAITPFPTSLTVEHSFFGCTVNSSWNLTAFMTLTSSYDLVFQDDEHYDDKNASTLD